MQLEVIYMHGLSKKIVLPLSLSKLELNLNLSRNFFYVTAGAYRKSTYPGKGLSGSLSGAAPLPPINQTSSGYETSGALTSERLRKRAESFTRTLFEHFTGFAQLYHPAVRFSFVNKFHPFIITAD